MRLVARQAVNLGVYLGGVGRVDHIRYGMALERMSAPKLQGQNPYFVLREIVFRKLHPAIENRGHMLRYEFLWLGLMPMAFQTQSIHGLGAQQMIVGAAVRFVAGSASLLESGLMQHVFLRLLGLIRVASEANADRIGLGQSWLAAGMRIVAVRAIPGCARMRHFRAFNLLCLFVVAGYAQRFRVGLCEHDFSVLGRRMAQVARLIRKRRMQKLPHQLRSRRLVRIMATGAVRGRERLVVMRLLQVRRLDVVAVNAQSWSALGQVKIELRLACLACLMRRMASVAAHVECGVPAAFLGDVQSLLVAIETEILPLPP